MWASGAPTECSAVIDRHTGRIYRFPDAFGGDECADDIDAEAKYSSVSDKYALDLGNTFVFEFARKQPRSDCGKLRDIFRRSGTYSRINALLDQRQLRDEWHNFENSETRAAPFSWGADHNIEIVG
jgi:hypothetical protein